ncbi:MAG: lipopolysaccharide kinase InaA family protein, partial [Pseudomonas sp.]
MAVAMAFEQWWQLQGEWVEEPNHRRGGESGVQRL